MAKVELLGGTPAIMHTSEAREIHEDKQLLWAMYLAIPVSAHCYNSWTALAAFEATVPVVPTCTCLSDSSSAASTRWPARQQAAC